MATSYISEHSAEYYLVPALKEILLAQFEYVAPVFPWISRELSNISKRLHKEDQFHVLVMFPRRPKLLHPENREIYFTINWELDAFNKIGEENGVPIIIGCPRAVDLWDLSTCQNYAWLDMRHIKSDKYLNSINELDENGNLLEKNNILSLVRNSAIFNLESFEDFIRKAKRSQPQKLYGGQYKPVYFLIKT